MSDHLLRLIPSDPEWEPDEVALHRAVRVLRALVPDAERVGSAVHGQVVFVDAGDDAERIDCPGCGEQIDGDWWTERMERASAQEYARLAVTTPCCGSRTTLNDLGYVWPAGFARIELRVVNPGRGWLGEEERRRVEDALGHPVREVRAHY